MIDSESTFTDLLPKFDDPESPDRPDRIIHPADCDDDDEDQETLTPSQRRFGIYEKFFTPEERKKYAAIPVNDPTHEINLLRKLLFDTLEIVPAGQKNNKSLFPLSFQHDLLTTVSRAVYVISRLVALHMELNQSCQTLRAVFNEVIDELDPYDMSTYDWDLT